MNGGNQSYTADYFNMLGEMWKGALMMSGLKVGLFDELSLSVPQKLNTLAESMNLSPDKLDQLLYFFCGADIIQHTAEGYLLTERGSMLQHNSGNPELLGLMSLSEFYLDAALHSDETLMDAKSLDQLSQGKISRNYQPKVSDRFSFALADIFRSRGLSDGESLLDVGCGNGSMLRMLSEKMPEVSYTGVDSNLFAIDVGKRMLRDRRMSDKIRLMVGDITEDIDDFPEQSYDWVSAINVFHFVPEDKRMPIIENMVRIARKGVFMTEVMVEANPLSSSANPLMTMLWNDFTGFFRKSDMDAVNSSLKKQFRKWDMELVTIMQGNSNLLVMKKN